MSIKLVHNQDSVELVSSHRKSDWRKMSSHVSLKIKTLNDYSPQKDLKALSNPRDIEATLDLDMDSILTVSGKITCRTDSISILPRQKLGLPSQEVNMKFTLYNKDAELTIKGYGKNLEQIGIHAQSQLGPWKSLDQIKSGLRTLKAEISGYTRNLTWNLVKREFPLDLEIIKGTVDATGFAGKVLTSDGSSLEGSGTWKNGFSSRFSGSISPTERWATLWTGRHLSYHSLFVEGDFKKGALSIRSRFFKVHAYGAKGDSIAALHRIQKEGYYLDSAVIYYQGIPWTAHGQVLWKGIDRGLTFTADNPEFGRATYAMLNFDEMKAAVSQVQLKKSPYRQVKNLFPYEPRITGIFNWDIKKKKGYAEMVSSITLMGTPIELKLESEWNPKKLDVLRLAMEHNQEKLTAYGTFLLNGKHFFQAYRSKLREIKETSLIVQNLDAAGWINMFRDSLVKSAELNGDMSFSGEEGFSGAYEVSNLSFMKTDTFLVIPKLLLTGRGAGIGLSALIQSDEFKLLNDSINIELKELFKKKRSIEVTATADKKLNITLTGHLIDNSSFAGNLSMHGDLVLPGKAGRVKKLDLAGNLVFPLSKSSRKKLNFSGRLTSALYDFQDMDPVEISFPLSLTDKGIEFPNIRISNPAGQQVNGYGYYSFITHGDMEFHLRSDLMDLVLPAKNKVTMQKALFDIVKDKDGLDIDIKIEKGNYQPSSSTFKLGTTVKNLSLAYRVPKAKKRSLQRNTLKASLGIEDFHLYYKNYGLRQLQNLLGISDKRKKIKRKGKPLDVDLQVYAAGKNNRVEADLMRFLFNFNFDGDLNVTGTYPYLLVKGEINSLGGSFGITSQSYTLEDLSLRWENQPVEEGDIDMTAVKWLAESCSSPDSSNKCSIEIKLQGKLEKTDFSYGGSCAGDLGESLEPVVLLTSASKGCYDTEFSGSASRVIESEISRFLSRNIRRMSGNWIETSRVSGVGQWLLRDDESDVQTEKYNEPITLEMETREFQRLRLKGKYEYSREVSEATPSKYEAGVKWRPPLEDIHSNPAWKHRVKKRVEMEAMVRTGASQQTVIEEEEQEKDVRGQLGITYHYEFWDIW
ncbi:translocation/assembly module TamB domain-containing protein [Fibrobacterota bacterium]